MKIKWILSILLCIEFLFIVIFVTKTYEEDISYRITTDISDGMIMNTLDLQDELKLTKADKLFINNIFNKKKFTFYRFTASDGTHSSYIYLINGSDASFKTGSLLTRNSKKGSLYLDYIIRNSYPNISLEEMGVSTEEEAYLATKYALATVASKTKENTFITEDVDLYSKHEEAKRNHFSTTVFDVAERLVAYSELLLHDNVSLEPSIIWDVESSTFSINGGRITMGPYKVIGKNVIFGNMDITLKDELGNDISYTLLNNKGGVIRKIVENEEFYIAYNYNPAHPKITAYNKVQSFVVSSYIYEMMSNEGKLLKFVVPIRDLQTVEFYKDYVIKIGGLENEEESK